MTDTRPLHVLEMQTQFGVGGITRHVLSLTDWLRGQGHRVTLGGSPAAWAGPDDQPDYLDLPTRAVSGEGGGMPRRMVAVARSVWRLRAWLKANPVDVIHAHESAPALVANLARKGLGVPLIVTYHGSEPERIAAFGRIARGADLVITPSYNSAADLQRIGGVDPTRLTVLGLGVPAAPCDPPQEVAALRQRLLAGGDRLVMTLARLERQKGIDVLIRVAARLAGSHPGWRFAVAGDGVDEARLKTQAREAGVADRVIFLGRVERPHLYLRAADLFLLTSRWEALPFTIVEAFQAGIPAVATACSGVVELIDDTVGAVVPIGDVEAIAQAVRRILADETLRSDMARRALQRAAEPRFDPDWVHAQFVQTYRRLADGRAGAWNPDP
ncbi:glycosyltransferase involved in cell wall biosynthesis [Albidovulum inexpectatum]|uniref:Glycosyltransferase involved in cell wall biosynthesis n=1 Tax=Albidovulum inexpectatum TaxID=196587 RepID=A0A2S5JJ30_9RHOB|nr:glycosyltransferase family 4 protein [Albidovulum inexpectatum]PPB81479.1 glycosyltransferase involved in cell wall biosynthesis [Albidovulum inexpectatum]